MGGERGSEKERGFWRDCQALGRREHCLIDEEQEMAYIDIPMEIARRKRLGKKKGKMRGFSSPKEKRQSLPVESPN
jgi:hypothetical protein